MRRVVVLFSALTMMSASGLCLAADKSTNPAVDTEIQRILAAEDEYVAAEIAGDERALRRLVDDRFVFNSSDGSTSGKEELIRSVMSMDMVGQEITERSVIVEDKVAIIFGTAEFRFQSPGEAPRLSKSRYTSVYVDREGEWRMLGLQMQKYSSQ